MTVQEILEKIINNSAQLSKIKELNDVPYGILETEQLITIYFLFENLLIPKCTIENIQHKPILKELFSYIFSSQFEDINELFNVNKYEFDLFIRSRINYYKKLYNSNKKILVHKDKLIYSAVSLLYILSADKKIFEDDKKPFANDKLVEKETIRIRNDNYQKHGDLDKYYTEHYNLFADLYDFSKDIAEEIIKTIKKDSQKQEALDTIIEDSCDVDRSETKLILWIIGLISLFLILIMFWSSYIENYRYQQQQKLSDEISQTEHLIVKYQHEHDPMYNDMINKLAVLTHRSADSIKQEYEEKFNNEKKDIIKQIIDKMVEENIYDEDLKNRCLTIYFYNNKNEMDKEIKRAFLERKDELTKKIAKTWEETGKIDDELKEKYIASLFNNNINEFNRGMDKALGYKEFTLVPITSQQTKILYDNIIHTNQDGAIYVATYSSDLYLKIYDSHGHCITAFIRKNDALGIPVAPNNYKIEFYYGKNWYGTKFLFGKHTKKSETSQDAVISNYQSLYFDDSLFSLFPEGTSYTLTSSNSWYEQRRWNEQKVRRETDPNRNLKVNNPH